MTHLPEGLEHRCVLIDERHEDRRQAVALEVKQALGEGSGRGLWRHWQRLHQVDSTTPTTHPEETDPCSSTPHTPHTLPLRSAALT